MSRLIKQLKCHEGFRSNYYLCSRGKRTIGYGRNVDDNPFTELEVAYLGRTNFDIEPMTQREAESLLFNDVKAVESKISTLQIWNELCGVRKAVCINMAFQIGVTGFFGFKETIKAINEAFFEKAASRMLDSKWYREDTPERAFELSEQMRTGKWTK